MRTLARSALRKKDTGGDFLPAVLLPLESANLRVRIGTTTFVAGPPGAMKTALVLYLVLRWNLPTIYFSADAEDFEVVERAAAAISGDTITKVRANPGGYAEQLNLVSNVRFVFEDSPTYEDVESELSAYAEVFGEFPKVLVYDNFMNVVGENEDEWASARDTARFIHRLTRTTGAASIALAHMSDDRPDPSIPAPRSKLLGRVTQLPKAVWSLAVNGNELRVNPSKNRWGKSDPTGKEFASVWVEPERSRIYNSRTDWLEGRPA